MNQEASIASQATDLDTRAEAASDTSREVRKPPMGFLIVATTLIGLLHIYVGLRLLPAIGHGPATTLLGVSLLSLSTVLIPVGLLARMLTGWMSPHIAAASAWAGLIAMGFSSSLLVMTFLRDLLLLPAMALLSYDTVALFGEYSAWGVLFIATGFTIVGLVNALRLPQVVEVAIPLAKLPPELNGFRIAQLSDIHVGPTIRGAFLERIVASVNSLNAHMVAITGDLVDGSVRELRGHTQVLGKLQSSHGTFFVTGNHEYYSGADSWVGELRRLGITVLQNEHVVIRHLGELLVVAGVNDYSAHHFDERQRSNPAAALVGAPASLAKILLAHQPRSAASAEAAGFDLQLSGHTHGGQFWPWNFFVRLQQPYTAGLHKLRELWVYTSRGTGYWGPPKRLGAPAEITLLYLVSAGHTSAKS